jgi:hypothetical protein
MKTLEYSIILFLFSSFFLSSQELLPLENYIFKKGENKVLPMDPELGLLDENESINRTLIDLFVNGISNSNCSDEMLKINSVKYNLLEWNASGDIIGKISTISETNDFYEGRYIIKNESYKIKGTIYFILKNDKWLLFDMEGDNQDISNP